MTNYPYYQPHSNSDISPKHILTPRQTLEQVRDIFEDPNGIKYIGTPAWKTHNGYKQARAFEKGQLADDAEVAKGYSEKREGDGSSQEGSSPERANGTVLKA